jgi:hypothetical protein
MGAKFKYRNPWHKPHTTDYGPEGYTTDKKPIEYRGFQIFNRFKGCHELVKGGVCLTQRAGGGALHELADALLGEKNEHPDWLVASARAIAEKHNQAIAA